MKGGGGGGGDLDAPPFFLWGGGGKLYTFCILSVREEIRAKTTFLKIAFKTTPPPPPLNNSFPCCSSVITGESLTCVHGVNTHQ